MERPVVVVGGGVMGFASATRLLEAGFADVTLVAAELLGIASRSSPAVFRPDWLGETPAEAVIAWGLETRAHLTQLFRDSDGGSDAGVTPIVHVEVYRNSAGAAATRRSDVLAAVMDGFRAMTPTELELYQPDADGGWHYSSFMIEGARYVPHLRRRAEALGLKVVQGKTVPGLPGSSEFCRAAAAAAGRSHGGVQGVRIVVNALGLNGGPECFPVRGQLVLVKAPAVKLAMGEYNTKDHRFPTYVYPRRDHVVLGSTYLEGDGDKEVRPATTDDIIRRCAEFYPELAQAPVLAEVVCIRPGRKEGVRLERERVTGVDGGPSDLSVIHCYGHGGAGMSLAWGCGGNVARLALEAAAEEGSAIQARL